MKNNPEPKDERARKISEAVKAARAPDIQRRYQSLRDAAKRLQATGKPFTQHDVEREAGLSRGYIAKNPAIRADINQAIAATLQAWQQAQAVEAVPEQTEELDRQKQTIADLEDCNRQLRQQLSDVQAQLSERRPSQPTFVEVALPASWLHQQAQSWRETLSQIESDRESALSNLRAYERLIELHEVERPVATIAQLNGHRS